MEFSFHVAQLGRRGGGVWKLYNHTFLERRLPRISRRIGTVNLFSTWCLLPNPISTGTRVSFEVFCFPNIRVKRTRAIGRVFRCSTQPFSGCDDPRSLLSYACISWEVQLHFLTGLRKLDTSTKQTVEAISALTSTRRWKHNSKFFAYPGARRVMWTSDWVEISAGTYRSRKQHWWNVGMLKK